MAQDRLSTDHVLGIKYLEVGDLNLIFETAKNFKEVINRPIKKVPSLRDVTVANLFLKIQPAPEYPLSSQKSVSPLISLISRHPPARSKKAKPCWIR
jgi:hypothetical protein